MSHDESLKQELETMSEQAHKRTRRYMRELVCQHRRGEITDEQLKDRQMATAIKLALAWHDVEAFTKLCEQKSLALGKKFMEADMLKKISVIAIIATTIRPKPDIPEWDLVERVAEEHLRHIRITI